MTLMHVIAMTRALGQLRSEKDAAAGGVSLDRWQRLLGRLRVCWQAG
jgi:hypothetical protein